jgi:hypothetical protein
MNDQQQSLPGVRIWTDPQTVRFGDLGPVIVEGALNGWQAFRLDVTRTGYVVTFLRAAEGTKQPERRTFAPQFIERSLPPEPPEP